VNEVLPSYDADASGTYERTTHAPVVPMTVSENLQQTCRMIH